MKCTLMKICFELTNSLASKIINRNNKVTK